MAMQFVNTLTQTITLDIEAFDTIHKAKAKIQESTRHDDCGGMFLLVSIVRHLRGGEHRKEHQIN